MTIKLKAQVPDAETYLALRSGAGLSGYGKDAVVLGLKNTLHAVMLFDGEKAVGMGRLIGDGGLFLQITDIAVLPEYQGQGLGKRIMAALTDYMETELPKSAYVSLIADVPANGLYEQFGFKETAPRSVGMARRAGSI